MLFKRWFRKPRPQLAVAPSRQGIWWVVIVVLGMTLFPLLVLLLLNLQGSGL